MGSVYNGIPKQIARDLKLKYGMELFIETGTMHGHTAAWAARHFKKIITMDIYPDYINDAKTNSCAQFNNIEFHVGFSSILLQDKIMPLVKEQALFWLDAHWGGDLHYPAPAIECPLMNELRVIKSFGDSFGHVILIDDARLFIKAPPPPMNADVWPSYKEIEDLLSPTMTLNIADDIIICEPKHKTETSQNIK